MAHAHSKRNSARVTDCVPAIRSANPSKSLSSGRIGEVSQGYCPAAGISPLPVRPAKPLLASPTPAAADPSHRPCHFYPCLLEAICRNSQGRREGFLFRGPKSYRFGRTHIYADPGESAPESMLAQRHRNSETSGRASLQARWRDLIGERAHMCEDSLLRFRRCFHPNVQQPGSCLPAEHVQKS